MPQFGGLPALALFGAKLVIIGSVRYSSADVGHLLDQRIDPGAKLRRDGDLGRHFW